MSAKKGSGSTAAVVVDKKRLGRQAKKLLRSLEADRKAARAEVEAKLRGLAEEIAECGAEIERLRNSKATHREKIEGFKQRREELMRAADQLRAELSGEAEVKRIDEQLSASKSQWMEDREKRRQQFQQTAKKSFGAVASDSRASHASPFAVSAPDGKSLITRDFSPLGMSYPEDGVVEWTRFDFKPKRPWVVRPADPYFSYVPVLGSGEEPKTNKVGADAGPLTPQHPSLAKHEYPWRTAPSDGSKPFSSPAPDPQPGPSEMAERRSADVLDRRRYKPASEGKEPWRPTDRDPKVFSSPPRDTAFLHAKQTSEVENLMTRFGLTAGGTGQMAPEAVDEGFSAVP